MEKLLVSPEKHLVPLVGELAGFYKFRVGDYRLLCSRKGALLTVTIIRIAHRREIYH